MSPVADRVLGGIQEAVNFASAVVTVLSAVCFSASSELTVVASVCRFVAISASRLALSACCALISVMSGDH